MTEPSRRGVQTEFFCVFVGLTTRRKKKKGPGEKKTVQKKIAKKVQVLCEGRKVFFRILLQTVGLSIGVLPPLDTFIHLIPSCIRLLELLDVHVGFSDGVSFQMLLLVSHNFISLRSRRNWLHFNRFHLVI